MSPFLLPVLVMGCVVACGRGGGEGSGSASGRGSADAPPCAPMAFADSTPVPEASGAGWLTLDGNPALVVVSDSGNDGAYAIVNPDSGATREQGKLPLGAAADDIEGIAVRGERMYGLSSSGWIRGWERSGASFTLVEGPYAIGPVDLSDRDSQDRPPGTNGMVCGAQASNCGRNYEGFCLVEPARAAGPCAGFAAAKADGHLYCLADEGGKLVVRRDLAIKIARPGVVADCAFDGATLWVGSNLFDLAQVYRVAGWQDPKTAKVTAVAPLGIGFPEVLAARDNIIYRLSDTGGAPSLMSKFRCRPAL